jgi:hypothetical protein
MRITHMALVALLLGTGLSLGACDSLDNLTNLLDTKKRLPGDRRPVFPDGVPGVEMGVPPEMMKGYQEKQQAESQAQPPPGAQAAGQGVAGQSPQADQQQAEKPKPKKVVTRPKPKPAPSDTSQQASAPPAQTAAWPAQPAQAAPAQATAPWPGQQPQQQQAPAWPTSR